MVFTLHFLYPSARIQSFGSGVIKTRHKRAATSELMLPVCHGAFAAFRSEEATAEFA
jgi:hypothetical protein